METSRKVSHNTNALTPTSIGSQRTRTKMFDIKTNGELFQKRNKSEQSTSCITIFFYFAKALHDILKSPIRSKLNAKHKAKLSAIKVSFYVNTLRLRQHFRHFANDIFEYILFNENVWIPMEISLMFIPKGQINKIQALVQIMTGCRAGDMPLSEP